MTLVDSRAAACSFVCALSAALLQLGCGASSPPHAAEPVMWLQTVDREHLDFSGSLAELVERARPTLEAHDAKLLSLSETRAKYRLHAGGARAELVLRREAEGVSLRAIATGVSGTDELSASLQACKDALSRAAAEPPAAAATPSDASISAPAEPEPAAPPPSNPKDTR